MTFLPCVNCVCIIAQSPTARDKPSIDITFISGCGMFAQYGSAPVNSAPVLNYYSIRTNGNSWTAALSSIFFPSSSISTTNANVVFSDTSSYSFDLFSQGGSFTIAFYYQTFSDNQPQAIFTITTYPTQTVTDRKRSCLTVQHVSCSSGYCAEFSYYSSCTGYGGATGYQWQVMV